MEALSKNELITLSIAYTEEETTNERLRYVLDMHRSDITQMLGKMCSDKLLEAVGYGRGTKYHVYGDSRRTGDANAGLVDKNDTLQPRNVKKKRYSPAALQKLILESCSDWSTAAEIAQYVGRTAEYIRDKVLPKMAGVLDKYYDIPHHPNQKYRVKQVSNC